MAFITTTKKRGMRKELLYHVIMEDLIKLGVIDHTSIKNGSDLVNLLHEAEMQEKIKDTE